LLNRTIGNDYHTIRGVERPENNGGSVGVLVVKAPPECN